MKHQDLAKLLGIKLSHTTASGRGEYWQLKTPASVQPHIFSKNGPAVYEFATEKEVEAFVSGYSLVLRAILQHEHTPT
jgi:hypothetical protein